MRNAATTVSTREIPLNLNNCKDLITLTLEDRITLLSLLSMNIGCLRLADA